LRDAAWGGVCGTDEARVAQSGLREVSSLS
jgi:hypothetical protein